MKKRVVRSAIKADIQDRDTWELGREVDIILEIGRDYIAFPFSKNHQITMTTEDVLNLVEEMVHFGMIDSLNDI